MKVRVNAVYCFTAALIDREHSAYNGRAVRVINLRGCPTANTMGHCYIETADAKQFIGLVSTGSLTPLPKLRSKLIIPAGAKFCGGGCALWEADEEYTAPEDISGKVVGYHPAGGLLVDISAALTGSYPAVWFRQ